MFIASLLVIVGLIGGMIATRAANLRLGGVVIVPLLVVYTLYNFFSLPVFLLSFGAAYATIVIIDRRLLIYGRQRLLISILLGALVPILILFFIDLSLNQTYFFTEVEFAGSILPGIAAYNLFRMDPEDRVADIFVTVGLFITLLVMGFVALDLWVTPPCWTCGLLPSSPGEFAPSLLLHSGSDTAALMGTSHGEIKPIFGNPLTVLSILVFGILLAEGVRNRWGLRVYGVVALALMALFSLQSRMMLPLYLGAFLVAYIGVKALHVTTLLYGRILLSMSITIAILFGLPLVGYLPITAGLMAFFVLILAGIGAYNIHVQAPAERPAAMVIGAGNFVIIFVFARSLIDPSPDGLTATFSNIEIIVAMIVVLAALWQGYLLERRLPTKKKIQEASIFSDESRLES